MGTQSRESKQVLLISVQSNLSVLGLKYVHYSLLANGWNSHLLLLPKVRADKPEEMEQLRYFVNQVTPFFIGVTLMSHEYGDARDVSIFLKEQFPEIPIIWGGIHPTIEPETCFPYADYVCIGEGEQTTLDFAEALTCGNDPKSIQNLCYMEGDQVRRNLLRPYVENLDEIPYYEHLPRQTFLQTSDGNISPLGRKLFKQAARYQGKMYEVMTSRGCAFSCTYCCNNYLSQLYGGKKIRRRSIANIISELENALSRHPEISLIHFQDDAFLSCGEKYLEDFCLTYKEKINLPFIVHTIPVYVTEKKLRLLKESGLNWLNMGLQSGSDRVNNEIYKRKSTRDHFLKAVNMVKKFDIAGKYDVILDNPFENISDRIETIETLIQIPKPYLLEFFSLTYYPGTELYERALQEYPDQMESAFKKNYLKYQRNTLNELSVMAVFLPKRLMVWLLSAYQEKGEQDQGFNVIFFLIKTFLVPFFKLKSFVEVLTLSYGGSFTNAVMNVPMYLKEIFFVRKI
ncbi:MAG: cobalamin-dependent protein [Anaerolineales bacterium]|nr:cobalamin-dependent protein [Anaerolineales bacterium]